VREYATCSLSGWNQHQKLILAKTCTKLSLFDSINAPQSNGFLIRSVQNNHSINCKREWSFAELTTAAMERITTPG
jgi:hypothetical protein